MTLDPVALASLLVSVLALGVAWHAVTRSDRNGSAASMIALNEAFRQAWERFLGAGDDEDLKTRQFAELANLLEIACALDLDNAFKGKVREILREYLRSVVKILSRNDDAKRRLGLLKEEASTFKYITAYFRKHRIWQ